MSDFFRYEPQTLDERLDAWRLETGRDRDDGFSAIDLTGGVMKAEGFGPVTAQLDCLVYWLFTSPQPIRIPTYAGPKTVSVARIRSFKNAPASTQLMVGEYPHAVICAPIPRVASPLLGAGIGDFRDCRSALHDAAEALTERVNLIWPTVRTIQTAAGNG